MQSGRSLLKEEMNRHGNMLPIQLLEVSWQSRLGRYKIWLQKNVFIIENLENTDTYKSMKTSQHKLHYQCFNDEPSSLNVYMWAYISHYPHLYVLSHIFPCAHMCSVVSDSVTPWIVARQAPLCLWDSPGKNSGVGCRFFLQGIFWPRDQTRISCVSCLSSGFFAAQPPGKAIERCHKLIHFM